MTPYELASTLIALAAIGVAWRSLTIAKESETHATTANRIAEDALGKASAANEIAVRANQISEEANALVERSVTLQEEDWFVDWSAKWEKDASTLHLTNTGRDCARQVSVVVTAKDLHRVRPTGPEDVDAGLTLTFPMEEIGRQRAEHHQKEWARVNAMRASGIMSGPSGTPSPRP